MHSAAISRHTSSVFATSAAEGLKAFSSNAPVRCIETIANRPRCSGVNHPHSEPRTFEQFVTLWTQKTFEMGAGLVLSHTHAIAAPDRALISSVHPACYALVSAGSPAHWQPGCTVLFS